MPDNVVTSTGPVSVATKQDAAGVQHQRVAPEVILAGVPQDIADSVPLPTSDSLVLGMLAALLIEVRVQNEMMFQLVSPPSETLDSMRDAAAKVPIA